MKKTFISPVATILATEPCGNILQGSVTNLNTSEGVNGSDGDEIEVGARRGAGVGPSVGLDLETLDF